MSSISKKISDPKETLQIAIQQLSAFTESNPCRLEIGEDGSLVATKEDSCLAKIMGLARSYILPFFSDRKEREKKFEELKQAILRARDHIQSLSPLIEKYKEGDEAQRKLAEAALLVIRRYNEFVLDNQSVEILKNRFYNYERGQLLMDQEIKGRPIEIASSVSIKYQSHSDTNLAHKILSDLSQIWSNGNLQKQGSSLSLTHKKNLQFMIDTFHLKARRMMEAEAGLQHFMASIESLIKKTPLKVEEKNGIITMHQLIEIDADSFVLVRGSFKKYSSDSKFLAMPILDSFKLDYPLTAQDIQRIKTFSTLDSPQ